MNRGLSLADEAWEGAFRQRDNLVKHEMEQVGGSDRLGKGCIGL